MLRARVGSVVESNRFQMFIVGVIVVNAITLGAETSTVLSAMFGPMLTVIDHLALAIFTVELAARLYAFGWKFFKDPWNVFDFVIVAIALIPTAGPLSVLRSLRILRALRLVAMVPSMRRVVTALVRSIPGLVSLSGLLMLLLYVGGVIASNLFGDTGDPRFTGLGPTLLTLFQITTGDGWSDVMRDLMDQKPFAWIFFLVYLLVVHDAEPVHRGGVQRDAGGDHFARTSCGGARRLAAAGGSGVAGRGAGNAFRCLA
jgi:voltage-gated sodium channel